MQDAEEIEYGASHLWWGVLNETAMGHYLYQKEYAFIKEQFQSMPPEPPTLEIGCGNGRITRVLDEMGIKMVGIDLNFDALNPFHQQVGSIPLVQGRGLQLPFVDGCFGAVVVMQSFEYFQHEAFMKECNRVLRKGGCVIFDALNRSSYKWRLKRLVGRALNRPSANLSYQEILSSLKENGFQIQVIRGYNWAPFTRDSNSPLINIAASLEGLLRLDRYYKISPKILVAAIKRN